MGRWALSDEDAQRWVKALDLAGVGKMSRSLEFFGDGKAIVIDRADGPHLSNQRWALEWKLLDGGSRLRLVSLKDGAADVLAVRRLDDLALVIEGGRLSGRYGRAIR